MQILDSAKLFFAKKVALPRSAVSSKNFLNPEAILLTAFLDIPVHRRRIKTEENAKVFAAVWETEFI